MSELQSFITIATISIVQHLPRDEGENSPHRIVYKDSDVL